MTLLRVVSIAMAASALGLSVLSGCSGRAGGQELEQVNNQLREQNLELQEKQADLERQNAELLQALEAKGADPGELPAAILANLPRVTSISLDRLSGVHEGASGHIVRAYVQPVDGRNRFTQLVGEVTVKLVHVPKDEDAMTIAERTFDPNEVREAYRSGFMGTHYTFEMPVTMPEEPAKGSWMLLVQYDDGVTDETLRAERAIEWGEK